MWVTVLIMVIIMSWRGMGLAKGSPWSQVEGGLGESLLRDFQKLLPG